MGQCGLGLALGLEAERSAQQSLLCSGGGRGWSVADPWASSTEAS